MNLFSFWGKKKVRGEKSRRVVFLLMYNRNDIRGAVPGLSSPQNSKDFCESFLGNLNQILTGAVLTEYLLR